MTQEFSIPSVRKYHAIYECERNGETLDYCREDVPVEIDNEDDARAWAQALQERYSYRNPEVTGFRLELW